MSEVKLDAVKRYMRVTYSEDDLLISSLISAAEQYLEGAGINRMLAPDVYDLLVCDMVLRQYDGRDSDAEHAAASPLARQMLTQLKLRSAYGSEGAT
ncbi:MAG: head-tail connector protein [Clostridiales bacterium]|nr:head-tail connector protein [Clostridiales bacterium]